jgi:hypothetical protein
MKNQINGTPKATFYLNELASEMTALFIEIKYENHYESIYQDGQDSEELNYKDYIQEEFDAVYDEVFQYLQSNQIK